MPQFEQHSMDDPAKRRRPRLAAASFACSIAPGLLAAWSFWIYFFGPDTKKAGEDVLSSGLVSLWLAPLALAGLGLGAFARGFRIPCVTAALVTIACWLCIIIADGGLW